MHSIPNVASSVLTKNLDNSLDLHSTPVLNHPKMGALRVSLLPLNCEIIELLSIPLLSIPFLISKHTKGVWTTLATICIYFSIILGQKESVYVLQSHSFWRAEARDSFFSSQCLRIPAVGD